MRIVVVSPALPLPFGETAARGLYAVVREMAARRHEVACLVCSSEGQEMAEDARARLNSPRIALKYFSLQPDANLLRRKWRNFRHPYSELAYAGKLKEALANEIKKGYDVLHLEHLWTGWLGLNLARSVLNIINLDIIDWQKRTDFSLYERKVFFQMRRATRLILRANSNFVALTERLRAKVLELAPGARCWVVPFTIDASLYSVQDDPVEPVVGMIGSMNWFPSRSAAERLLSRIWPLIKQRRPDARLLICGWNAKKYLGRLLPLPDIQVEENIPHPLDFFRRTSVLVYAPPTASGMKVKVMEAMAYGVPVVTNAEGVEGLDCANGEECFVEENDRALAERAMELLGNGDLRNRMRKRARALIEGRYSPKRVVGQLLEVYEAIRKQGNTPGDKCPASQHS